MKNKFTFISKIILGFFLAIIPLQTVAMEFERGLLNNEKNYTIKLIFKEKNVMREDYIYQISPLIVALSPSLQRLVESLPLSSSNELLLINKSPGKLIKNFPWANPCMLTVLHNITLDNNGKSLTQRELAVKIIEKMFDLGFLTEGMITNFNLLNLNYQLAEEKKGDIALFRVCNLKNGQEEYYIDMGYQIEKWSELSGKVSSFCQGTKSRIISCDAHSMEDARLQQNLMYITQVVTYRLQ